AFSISSQLHFCPLLSPLYLLTFAFFFFNAPATTEIYTLSLHDALPISWTRPASLRLWWQWGGWVLTATWPSSPTSTDGTRRGPRSEEHTSELQSRGHLVCRLLLEKKKKAQRERV